MATWRKFSGLIAALMLAAMGMLLFFSSDMTVGYHPFLGGVLACMGLGLAGWQAWSLRKNRDPYRDPYDLNALWDAPEPDDLLDDPDDEFIPENSSLLCRHCGEAIGGGLRVCPHCKNLL
jgi:hypothetical protein